MIDFPWNSSTDLGELILYDIFQWKTIDKSYKTYERMCEVLEKEAISYDNYEYWFNRYLKESHYYVRGGSAYWSPDLDVCILADVIDGKSVENSYRLLCDAETSENYKINKEAHATCYERYYFVAHQHALIMAERSVNTTLPDTCNNLGLTFSDLPFDVIAEIVDKCDLKSYLNLRDVSYSLRTIVDQRPLPCTDIDIHCTGEYIQIKANNEILVDSRPIELTHSRTCSLDYIEKRVFRELEFALRNPKLRLKSFRVDSGPSLYQIHLYTVMDNALDAGTRHYDLLIPKMLNSLNQKIHVEQCSIMALRENHKIQILQCFKPGTLARIEFNNECSTEEINQIARIDQWKQAKHVKLHGEHSISIEHFFHFSTFEVFLEIISTNDILRLCNNLRKSINFESCFIETRNDVDIDTIENTLNLRPSDTPDEYYIPNSNLVIQFSIVIGCGVIFIWKL